MMKAWGLVAPAILLSAAPTSAQAGVGAMSPAQVSVGDAPPERWFGPITRTDIVRYQGASGDMNPIHHDEMFVARVYGENPLAFCRQRALQFIAA